MSVTAKKVQLPPLVIEDDAVLELKAAGRSPLRAQVSARSTGGGILSARGGRQSNLTQPKTPGTEGGRSILGGTAPTIVNARPSIGGGTLGRPSMGFDLNSLPIKGGMALPDIIRHLSNGAALTEKNVNSAPVGSFKGRTLKSTAGAGILVDDGNSPSAQPVRPVPLPGTFKSTPSPSLKTVQSGRLNRGSVNTMAAPVISLAPSQGDKEVRTRFAREHKSNPGSVATSYATSYATTNQSQTQWTAAEEEEEEEEEAESRGLVAKSGVSLEGDWGASKVQNTSRKSLFKSGKLTQSQDLRGFYKSQDLRNLDGPRVDPSPLSMSKKSFTNRSMTSKRNPTINELWNAEGSKDGTGDGSLKPGGSQDSGTAAMLAKGKNGKGARFLRKGGPHIASDPGHIVVTGRKWSLKALRGNQRETSGVGQASDQKRKASLFACCFGGGGECAVVPV